MEITTCATPDFCLPPNFQYEYIAQQLMLVKKKKDISKASSFFFFFPLIFKSPWDFGLSMQF